MFDVPLDFLWLIPLVIAAFCHTSVGLAGGTSYSAILSASGLPILTVTSTSLTLNTIASSIGAINFARFKHLKPSLLLPFLASSAPCAYFGSKIVLPAVWFYIILILTLVLCIVNLLSHLSVESRRQLPRYFIVPISICIGAAIGFISGCMGIGGGIYLVPLIVSLGIASAKQAAACGIVFIWCNSVVGLFSRWESSLLQLENIFIIVIAVILGSAAGSYFGASRFPVKIVKAILVAVLLFALGILSQRLYWELL